MVFLTSGQLAQVELCLSRQKALDYITRWLDATMDINTDVVGLNMPDLFCSLLWQILFDLLDGVVERIIHQAQFNIARGAYTCM